MFSDRTSLNHATGPQFPKFPCKGIKPSHICGRVECFAECLLRSTDATRMFTEYHVTQARTMLTYSMEYEGRGQKYG